MWNGSWWVLDILFGLRLNHCLTVGYLVSQAEASERIVNAGNFVVGWYHSHPTFVPNPSLRDLETQEKYQEMFKQENNFPFIALILSPYSGSINPQHKTSLVSKFKCLMVSDDTSQVRVSIEAFLSEFETIFQQVEYKVPFEFEPLIVRKERLLVNVLNKTRHLCSYLEGRKTSHCMIDRIRGREITLVNKVSWKVFVVFLVSFSLVLNRFVLWEKGASFMSWWMTQWLSIWFFSSITKLVIPLLTFLFSPFIPLLTFLFSPFIPVVCICEALFRNCRIIIKGSRFNCWYNQRSHHWSSQHSLFSHEFQI